MKHGNSGKNIFLNILNRHAPRRDVRARNKPAPWINSTLRQQMHARDMAKKKATQTNNAQDWSIYKRMRDKINYEVKRTKSLYYSKKLHDNSGNCKDTWSILNDLLGKKSGQRSMKLKFLRLSATLTQNK